MRRLGNLINLVIGISVIAMGEARRPPEPAPPAPFAEWKPGPGRLTADIAPSITLHDAKRGKDLDLWVSWPREPGRYPVIVFSHGAMGSGDTAFPIAQRWVTHGYVVICPTHADSIRLRRRQGVPPIGQTLRNIRRSGGGVWDPGWEERPRDVRFTLDALPEIERAAPGLAGRMDPDRIGVAGHSLGAYTAQVVAGASVMIPGRPAPISQADPRIRAALLLSGQGAGEMGLHAGSWSSLRLPMMSVTGSLDRGAMGQPPLWRREPFTSAPAGGKYFLFIEGAGHGSFTGSSGLRLRPAAIPALVLQATTAFWDAHLKDDPAASRWLASSAPPCLERR